MGNGELLITLTGKTKPGGKTKWPVSTVKSVLENEKYMGCALLQKTFTVDFLTKKTKENEGEVPQYFVKDHHTAIIDPQTFDLVQTEIAWCSENGRRYSGVSIFSSKLDRGAHPQARERERKGGDGSGGVQQKVRSAGETVQ